MTTNTPFPHNYLEDARKPVTESLDIISGNFTASRFFVGPYDKRFNFVFEYLMQPIEFSGGTTLFSVPQAYPDLPIVNVDKVTISAEGKASVNPLTDAPLYDRARIRVDYRHHNFNFASEPITALIAYQNNIFIEEDHDQYINSLELTGDKVKVDGVAKEATDKFRFPLSRGDLVLRQHFIISPDWITLDLLKGTCNQTVFITPAGVVYREETLKYEGYSATSKVNITDNTGENFPLPVWEVEHRFSYDRFGWNNIIDEDDWREKVTVRDLLDNKFFKPVQLFLIFMEKAQLPSTTDLSYIQTRLDTIDNLYKTATDMFTPAYFQAIAEIRQKLKDMGFRV